MEICVERSLPLEITSVEIYNWFPIHLSTWPMYAVTEIPENAFQLLLYCIISFIWIYSKAKPSNHIQYSTYGVRSTVHTYMQEDQRRCNGPTRRAAECGNLFLTPP